MTISHLGRLRERRPAQVAPRNGPPLLMVKGLGLWLLVTAALSGVQPGPDWASGAHPWPVANSHGRTRLVLGREGRGFMCLLLSFAVQLDRDRLLVVFKYGQHTHRTRAKFLPLLLCNRTGVGRLPRSLKSKAWGIASSQDPTKTRPKTTKTEQLCEG